jgi:hypothetical protein
MSSTPQQHQQDYVRQLMMALTVTQEFAVTQVLCCGVLLSQIFQFQVDHGRVMVAALHLGPLLLLLPMPHLLLAVALSVPQEVNCLFFSY